MSLLFLDQDQERSLIPSLRLLLITVIWPLLYHLLLRRRGRRIDSTPPSPWFPLFPPSSPSPLYSCLALLLVRGWGLIEPKGPDVLLYSGCDKEVFTLSHPCLSSSFSSTSCRSCALFFLCLLRCYSFSFPKSSPPSLWLDLTWLNLTCLDLTCFIIPVLCGVDRLYQFTTKNGKLSCKLNCVIVSKFRYGPFFSFLSFSFLV